MAEQAGNVISGETDEERKVRLGLLERHPAWDIALRPTDFARWWVIRNHCGILMSMHRDIAIAGEVAERRRVL